MSDNNPPKLPRCGLALASLILGIASYFTCGLTILPAVICGIIALNKIKASNGALGGRGQAIAGIIVGAAAVFVIAIGGLVAAIAIPSFAKARGSAQATLCMNNLKQLGMACQQYALDHNDTLPTRLEELEPYAGGIVKRIFVWPCAAPNSGTSYRLLLPGVKLSSLPNPSSSPMIICESGKHPQRGYIYICADGHVESSQHPPVVPLAPRQPTNVRPPARTDLRPTVPPPSAPQPVKPGTTVESALEDLKSGDLTRAAQALLFLKKATLDDGQRVEVNKAAAKFVEGAEITVHSSHAINNAIQLLGESKDPSAGTVVAKGLSNFFTSTAAQEALGKLGAEKAAHPYLQRDDWRVRLSACKVLGKIGTAESKAALEVATKDKNRLVGTAAKDALKAIAAR